MPLRGRSVFLSKTHPVYLFSLLLDEYIPLLKQMKIGLAVEVIHRGDRLTSDLL